MSDVPVVPDSDRRSTATLSASTGPVTVGFAVYGGAADLSVFVDGVLIDPSDWVLTSASALNVLTDVLPAGDGRVTFNSPQTGSVAVIGEIKPKRLSQFTVGVGITAESHNLVLSTIIACLREVYSWGKSAIRLNEGERAAALPSAANRALKLLSFDAVGNPIATISIDGITGPAGPDGAKGFYGRKFLFDATTSDADPGAGKFRLNNAAAASATAIYIDNVDINSASATGWLDSFDDNNDTARRGILQILSITDDTIFAEYLVTGSVVDGTGYRKLTVSYLGGNGALSGNCAFLFAPAGNKGTDGAGTGDVTGQASSVDSEIALFSGTGGKTIKRASVSGMLKAVSGVLSAAVAGTDYLAPAAIGVTVQGYDAATIKGNVENQTLTGGVEVTSKALNGGSAVTTGTLTLDVADRPLQHYTNGGAHTLAPGSVNGACMLDITNNGSAGAITTSGWTKVVGSFTTTNGHKFRCHCSVGNGGSLLIIQALQ